MSNRAWWLLSAALSLAAIVALLLLWQHMNAYEVEIAQLTDRSAIDEYIRDVRQRQGADVAGAPDTIETGIFIQSLKFFDSAEVHVSGYIWQRYRDGVNEHLKPAPGEVGFVLPEQVNSGNDIEPREVYRIKTGAEEVIGWYFEATLRQPFEYSMYPFDHKTVWVRMWPRQFSGDIVLVPDFAAYDSTGPADIFGIEDSIVLGTWDRENTYFDYRLSSYSTNFGIDHYVGQKDFPELHYNFVIKRKFGNAFIVHLLPLFLVAALLYAALLTITDDEEIASRHGFNTSGVIATCSALFFVVLLAHIQLREQFAGSSIVYMEYFYFLMYGLLVAASAYAFLFAIRAGKWISFLHYRDNMVLKTAYWPFVFVAMVIITVFHGA